MGIYGNTILRNQFLIENINITPDQINKIFGDVILSESVLLEASNNTTKSLEKLGVKNKKEVNKIIKNSSEEIAGIIKNEGINKNVLQKVTEKFQQYIDSIIKTLELTDVDYLKFGNYDINKIKKAFILFVVILIINSIVMSTILMITGSNLLSTAITGTICTPFTEELGKHISNKGGFGVEFAVVFNSCEFLLYMGKKPKEVTYTWMIIQRLKTVGMHVFSQVVQWFISNTKIQEKLGIKDKETVSTIGYIIGVIIHCIWNLTIGDSLLVFKMAKNHELPDIEFNF